MKVSPVILEGQHVSLESLSATHEHSLILAAGDGELWNSTVTIVPSRATIGAYIATALNAQAEGHALPFVLRDRQTQREQIQKEVEARFDPTGLRDRLLAHHQTSCRL